MPTIQPVCHADNLNWHELAAQKGQTVRGLMFATGLSDEAVRVCLRDKKLPKNPIIAGIFSRALGLSSDPVTGLVVEAQPWA